MKIKLLLSIFLLFSISLEAQIQSFCGHADKLKGVTLPIHVKKTHSDGYSKSDQYVIPVVFHILHLNGPENISDEQIMSAMDALNEDFNKLNEDLVDVIDEFTAIIANVGVTFKLVRLDPEGQPTTGINRIYTNLTNHGWEDSSKINQWPPHKYLNIWVSKSLEGYAAAYSWYPEYADYYPELDGIMQQHDYTGSIGTSNEYLKHVLTHEVGHYFNLYHPWDLQIGDGPCGDDEVDDTPITQSSECILDLATCTPSIVENVQNFMTGTYCFRMFTEGQKNRMIETLNSPVGNRNNLWQEQNLIDTGLLDADLSISKIGNSSFSFAPNPATNTIQVKFSLAQTSLQLVNLFGQILLDQKTDNSSTQLIDVSHFPNGTYVLRYGNSFEKLVLNR